MNEIELHNNQDALISVCDYYDVMFDKEEMPPTSMFENSISLRNRTDNLRSIRWL